MATVSFRNASLRYPGAERPSVRGLDLDIADGEFLVLVGPSGCGKSTSLRMLAGLEAVTEGSIHIGDTDVTDVEPQRRDVAMVFQNYALYPNMTVAANMGFALRNARVPKDEIATRVAQAASMLELTELLDRKPAKLSGGQRQRVAMGRAIVRRPQVFAMDEPLSNLDARLRVSTRAQISALQRSLGVTTIYVTHDQVEAMTMGDRVAVMLDGELQQLAAPRELYDDPVNAFVAGFVGSPGMNLVTAKVTADGAQIGTGTVEMAPAVRSAAAGGTVTVGIRPESVTLAGAEVANAIEGKVRLLEELGADSLLHVTLDGTDAAMVARVPRTVSAEIGATVRLRTDPAELLFFNADSGVRLRP
ncbi:ABC transporter ATP-binding protein [Williamsia sp. CHRR-6]|uniref:ABC transporter ATP-binding protein n=1 Tax=Williamsia sp. CHRR-6 TaxID=2835871 RepID=UPI001BD99C18|nr:sn-glycerol-3-phosphate ABC transporter ATP-binding protein UgpC [Williamsia sp. CHRR-6]MBT0566922.1 sn-glycerol-3-phosphate ABC transporter ATP-binding protein UgpC [Williamsia sp. CHRR-6]